MYKRTIFNIETTIAALFQTGLLLVLMMTASAVDAAEKGKIDIEKFSLNRSVAYLGEEISASVTVNVPSSLRKETLRVRYYLDEKEIGKQALTDFSPAGRIETVFSFKGSSEGRFQFRIIADIEGKTGKTDEVSRQLAILSLPGGMTSKQFSSHPGDKAAANDTAPGVADLEPLSIEFSIASPRLGQKIRIKSRISNTGSVQADNVKVRLFINGQPYGKDIKVNIAAGSQVNIEKDFLPTREGKKDILLLINPDGEIDEKSNRNNLLSKTLIVRPAAKAGKRKKLVAAPAKSPKKPGRANLVVYIETISGIHYTNDGQVRFYITNNSQSTQSKPFTFGVQLLQASDGKVWLIRHRVKALKAGETVRISTLWPKDQLSTTNLFLAMVDIEGQIEETNIRDNHTRPFRVVSTATISPTPLIAEQLITEQSPEITIIHPAKNRLLPDNNKLVIHWKTRGDIGSRVRISISNKSTKEKILSSITNNDGQYSVDFSTQKPGRYDLFISTKDNKTQSRKRTFEISRKKQPGTPVLLSPAKGSSYRGKQQMTIAWPDKFKKKPGLQLNLVLLEDSSKKIIRLNKKPVTAAAGKVTWKIPNNGTVFGIYRLQATSLDGNVLAETKEIELLPDFVSVNQPLSKQGKKEIRTDLEIARTSFNGPNLEYLVMNNGPADISISGMLGYKFTSYFVRKTPITSDEDVVICHSSLLAEMPQGEGQLISLGRDPDCPLGERGGSASFEYVVNRFVLPELLDQYLSDPKIFNNTSKFYWPE